MKFYPLEFSPIFKDRIWGGTKLKTILHKPIKSNTTGESWELSAIEGDVSQVSNGILKGKSLNDLINEFPNELLGTEVFKRFGKKFPLLIKYLDAREDLSIQLHPNDELALKRHNSFGKTEMWYVMQADNEARIIVGFKEKSNPLSFIENLKNNSLLSILNLVQVKKGDAFLLETGTVHALGAGIMIAEIQQTSDITYRLYDFDRDDLNGNKRELHIDLALDAINYETIETKKQYSTIENTSNQVVDCQYFTTNFIPLNGKQLISKNGNSFTVYMCTDGDFTIEIDSIPYHYSNGETVLIPASILEFNLIGKASILEIFIK